MKTRIAYIIFFIAIACTSYSLLWAQTSFQKVYGGTADEDVRRICNTVDGNILIAGSTLSYGAGSTDAYCLKLDETGAVIWANTYGYTDDDYFEWIEQTDDRGYILCGYTFSFIKQNFKIIILKTDSNGVMQWQKQIGLSSVARSYCIRQTFDRGYILSGEEDSSSIDGNILLMKLDSTGNLQWNRSFGLPVNTDAGHCVIQTRDSGFAICGQSRVGIYSSFAVVIKTDVIGNLTWSRNYYHSNPSSNKSYAYRVHELQSGNLIVSGSSYRLGQFVSSMLVFEMEPNGTIATSNVYSTSAGDAGFDLLELEDGSGYLICGQTSSPQTGTSHGLILKVDPFGNQLWNECYGNDSLDGYFYSCAIKNSNKVILAGNTYSYGAGGQDVFVASRDSSSQSNDCNTHSTTFSTISYPLINYGSVISYNLSLAVAPLNFIASSGVVAANVCLGTTISEFESNLDFNIFPNPGKDYFTIENPTREKLNDVIIYDQLGRLVFNFQCNSDESIIGIKLPDLQCGIYHIKMIRKDSHIVKLFALQ